MKARSMSVAGLLAVLAAIPALPIAPASAQSTKLQEMEAHDKEQVAKLAKQTNAACGTQIAFGVDYPSYAHVLDDVNNQNPWAYLANATDALKHVCASDAGKAKVQAKIKSVTVSNGAAESESLDGGAFHYTVPYRGHAPNSVVTWLDANL